MIKKYFIFKIIVGISGQIRISNKMKYRIEISRFISALSRSWLLWGSKFWIKDNIYYADQWSAHTDLGECCFSIHTYLEYVDSLCVNQVRGQEIQEALLQPADGPAGPGAVSTFLTGRSGGLATAKQEDLFWKADSSPKKRWQLTPVKWCSWRTFIVLKYVLQP